jgi:hypothetical protein
MGRSRPSTRAARLTGRCSTATRRIGLAVWRLVVGSPVTQAASGGGTSTRSRSQCPCVGVCSPRPREPAQVSARARIYPDRGKAPVAGRDSCLAAAVVARCRPLSCDSPAGLFHNVRSRVPLESGAEGWISFPLSSPRGASATRGLPGFPSPSELARTPIRHAGSDDADRSGLIGSGRGM